MSTLQSTAAICKRGGIMDSLSRLGKPCSAFFMLFSHRKKHNPLSIAQWVENMIRFLGKSILLA
ncbi:hypothetical protein [Brenneria salicis]|nr:hypothetical protein [Brenneria salicis]